MMSRSMSKTVGRVSRTAVAIALSLGVVAGGAIVSTPAMAAKNSGPSLKLSKGFQAVAADAQKAIDGVKGGGDPADAKAKLDAAFAAIANEDDRFMAGNLAVGLGGATNDPAMQKRGLEAMLQSGKVAEADRNKFTFFLGQIAFQLKDYPTAVDALQRAVTAGYKENDAEVLLAEAQVANNQAAQGLVTLKSAIETRKASGSVAPVNWYRRGLGVAYNAKLVDQAAVFAMLLARDYPSKENWAGAITVVREVGKFPAQETLDLMRLMDRTASYAEERDYIEYIQAADARRLPGEVLKVIQAGTASGKLRANDTFVSEARTIASERLNADKASLAGLERDARAANATSATAMGAGDAFLSYDQPGKAEELYTIALAKPGADTPRLLTRIGIAQVGNQKYAEAQANFAKVTGPRKPIADLWALYAAQQANPAAAQPAS